MAVMRQTPHTQRTAADESLKAQNVERDRCGLCGDSFTVTANTSPGVCPADAGRAYNGLAAGGGWE